MAAHIYSDDSMLAVGETPWHGLGVTLQEAPKTSREALRVSGLDWEVERRAMFLDNGTQVGIIDDGAHDSKKGYHAAIVRKDNGRILGVVGPHYTPLQNAAMGEMFDPLIADGSLSIETCGSLFNGRRVWMLGRFKGEDMTIAQSDTVRKYLLLAHGHDGSFAVRFGFTPIRVVCNNTLSLACGEKSKSRLVKCLHTRSLESNLQVLRDAMVTAEEAFELSAEQFRLLAARGVSRASLREYARIVVGASEDATKQTASERKAIGQIVGAAIEGRGNSGANWWHAYNGVTEWVTWERGRKQDNRLNETWFGKGGVLAGLWQ
jgi:phage/plasmid-like protein (TIGR03299 family)